MGTILVLFILLHLLFVGNHEFITYRYVSIIAARSSNPWVIKHGSEAEGPQATLAGYSIDSQQIPCSGAWSEGTIAGA